MIYLDHAASTPIADSVLQEMMPYLKENYGNPSSIHRFGRLTIKAIDSARKRVAELVGTSPGEILFTSGGTESNNTAINGIMNQNKSGQLITTSIEHDAILEPCKKLESSGFDVAYLPVNTTGLVDLQKLESIISEKTYLVSIMLANNEVGTIQPIAEIAKICKKYNVLLHTDAVQAVGKIPVNVKELGVDLMSISSHKINGPKGVGALYIRNGVKLDPFILGGGQENGMRSGTENVANIVGFGKACQIAKENLKESTKNLENLRNYLVQRVLSEISHVTVNGNKEKLPNNAHFTFLGVNGEDLIIKLDEHGVAASTGSACSVKTQKASHVLLAMGFSHEQITGSLRLSLGISNTKSEIDQTVEALKIIVAELRSVSPFKIKYGF
ncbi:MAG: cysteine desulfurase [Thaumarchaeota archaeon]|nr:cysteine desulfurase [Nitrososphaerota archaeon]